MSARRPSCEPSPSVDSAVPVLTGACEPLFTPRPLGPFLDVLPELDEDATSAATAVAALVTAVDEPTVIVLEDLHWADEATLDALHILGRRLEFPALVVVTYRENELGRGHPLRLVLGEVQGAERVVSSRSPPRRSPVSPPTVASTTRAPRAHLRQPVLRD